MAGETLSIIIPVFNEEKTISLTLDQLSDLSDTEVIVVDGGSQDQTINMALRFAQSHGVKVISSSLGRAHQMNTGATIATGNILLFLHADTRLPHQFNRLIEEVLNDPKTSAGAFELNIDSQRFGLRLIEKMVNWRSHVLAMPYGDQAIFLKASVFQQVGGFPDLPIMEDFEFIRRLRRYGKIAIIPVPVLTSGRRWEKLGVWKTTLINQLIVAGYLLGIPPTKLVAWYRGK